MHPKLDVWLRKEFAVFSKSCQHAMRILLRLSQLAPGELTNAEEVARVADVPPAYASKLLSQLAASGLVHARRGPRGGVMLGRSPHRISLMDVLEAVGEADAVEDCFLGFAECNESMQCPMHAVWKGLRGTLAKALLHRTLADFQPKDARARPRVTSPA